MASRVWTDAALREAADSLEGQEPEAAVRWAFANFDQQEIALACSFGAEDVALVHMMSGIQSGVRAFYLDTDLLFAQTYELIEQMTGRYDAQFERVSPLLTLEEQAEKHGEELWASSPDICCGIRKVEPLTRTLGGLKAWVTGIRREQSPTRANAKMVEWDAKFNLVKINPLVKWKETELWDYIKTNDVPYNVMHDQGYPSIGCTHCTRPVKPGEDPRAGRWSGFAKTECGLHK